MRSDGQRLERAQRVEVEPLDRFDLVAEEIDAGRQADLVAGVGVLAGEIDIDDPAAHGKIAGHFDLIQPVVAMLGEPDDQLLRLQRHPWLEREDAAAQVAFATEPTASAPGSARPAPLRDRCRLHNRAIIARRLETCSSLSRPSVPPSSSAGSTSGRLPEKSSMSSARSSASSRCPQMSRTGRFSCDWRAATTAATLLPQRPLAARRLCAVRAYPRVLSAGGSDKPPDRLGGG